MTTERATDALTDLIDLLTDLRADLVAESHTAALEGVRVMHAQVPYVEQYVIDALRASGLTWTAIAAEWSISPQGAQQKWGK